MLLAWEIFERVRLEADLVVLSACVSALGPEQKGEGLVGLTRAFQYAGAQTVAASLWNVDDRTTADLMVRLYRHLRSGTPKDRALRAAQVEDRATSNFKALIDAEGFTGAADIDLTPGEEGWPTSTWRSPMRCTGGLWKRGRGGR